MPRLSPERRAIRSVLEPFRKHRSRWLFHYPVYLNTFCLAYELAALLADGSPGPAGHPLSSNFSRHEWPQGLPTFTYERDIEIFVAVDSMIERARTDGHAVRREHVVAFTRYTLDTVFVRKHDDSRSGRWLLVTDVPQTADQLLEGWSIAPPRWLRQLGIDLPSSEDVRYSWDRQLHDLFDNRRKLYAFSAPMAAFLAAQPSKYQAQDAGLKAIPTYFVLRCNSGVDRSAVNDLRNALAHYYRLVLGSTTTGARYLHPSVGWEYGRIASTIGQPHPFWEVQHPENRSQLSEPDSKLRAKLRHRYAEILGKHHRP